MIHVVSAAIVADNHLLLAQRSLGTSYARKWCTPGGKVDPNETHRDALIRELHEELGFGGFPMLVKVVYTYDLPSSPTGEMVRVHCYEVAASTITNVYSPKCLDGTIGVGWFSQSDLFAKNLAPADDANRKALAELLK